MVGAVFEEGGLGFGEEGGGGEAAVAFGEDDFVEEADGGAGGGGGFALVDEFVECCGALVCEFIGGGELDIPCVCLKAPM